MTTSNNSLAARAILRLYLIPLRVAGEVAHQARKLAYALDTTKYLRTDTIGTVYSIIENDLSANDTPARQQAAIRHAALVVSGAVGALVAVAMLIARWVRGAEVGR